MTFLLRSTVSLLCLSLLAVGPAIAAGSDDEGDDEASTSAPRVKRQRGASVDDDNDQEELSVGLEKLWLTDSKVDIKNPQKKQGDDESP